MKEDNNLDTTYDKPAETPAADDGQPMSIFRQASSKTTEEEDPLSRTYTLKKILGGELLNAQYIRSQVWLILLIVAFTIVYITNRYNVQRDLIELDKLQDELQDAKYKALSASSTITEKSRESNVLNVLKTGKDSILHIATQPPYIINVPKE